MPEEKGKIGQEFGEVRQPIDQDKLNEYLKSELTALGIDEKLRRLIKSIRSTTESVPAIASPVQVRQFSYGQSNPTYILIDGK